MKTSKFVVLALLALSAPISWSASTSPADGYLTFIKVLKNANRMEDIDPYFPERGVSIRNKIVESLQTQPERDQVNQRILEELKSNIADVTVSSAKESSLHTRGTSSEGNPTAVVAVEGVHTSTGKAIDRWPVMELEKGVWKFSGSSTPPNARSTSSSAVTPVVEALPPAKASQGGGR